MHALPYFSPAEIALSFNICHVYPMANLTLFLTILKTVAKHNSHAIPPHLTPLTEGHPLPVTDNLEDALNEAGRAFDDAQCACLFANLGNLNFKDGRLQDRDLQRQAETALRIDPRDARDVLEAVETRFQTDKCFRQTGEWDLFCAGLLAMAHADSEFTAEERVYLQRFVPDLKHIEAGNRLVTDKSQDDLSDELAVFSSRQRRCLAAHAIGIMFIDGSWKGSEQEFLEFTVQRLRLAQFDRDRLLKGLHALFNVSVFG